MEVTADMVLHTTVSSGELRPYNDRSDRVREAKKSD